MKTLFTFIGLVLGGMFFDEEGIILGGFIGLIAGSLFNTRRRVSELEEQLRLIKSNLIDSTSDVAKSSPQHAALSESNQNRETESTEETPPLQDSLSTNMQDEAVAETDQGWAEPVEESIEPQPPGPISRGIDFITTFFTTGNVVVKVGAIILFFGIGFLLKYAVDRNMLPIELRLAGIAVFGIGLLITGWRLRNIKQDYALILQGTAVGILYMTVFAAAKLYPLIPLGMAFGLMFGLVLFSCMLAVMQDSRNLALFASVGGFLAPVLVSTGQGNHVALFSYYAVLNAGIFGIAWFKAWRILNWVGFMFTFVIASIWGVTSYSPEHFNTTEPFLILFFLYYLMISILFALKQPKELKGIVDGTLVFGTPLVTMTLQSALVKDIEYGMAFSALILAIIYLMVARFLWHRQVEYLRMLTESFLSFGVIFASLAIPLALDGRWTAAVWALEGGGIIWVGIRQNRLSARMFGLLLHLGGGIAFLLAVGMPRPELIFLNNFYIGCFLISLCGLFSSWQYYKNKLNMRDAEKDLHVILLIWAMSWWFGGGFSELHYHLDDHLELKSDLIFIALSFVLFTLIGKRLDWQTILATGVLMLPAFMLIAFLLWAIDPTQHPLAIPGFVAWPLCLLAQFWLLKENEGHWNKRILAQSHTCAMWLIIFLIAWSLNNTLSYSYPVFQSLALYTWGVIPALAMLVLYGLKSKLKWPLQTFPESYLAAGQFPVFVLLMIWTVFTCYNAGDTSAMTYLPILNPQDIAQLFVMLTVLLWGWRSHTGKIPAMDIVEVRHIFYTVAGVGFIWINSVVARMVYFYAGVPYRMDRMIESPVFQMGISLVWTLLAFAVMGISTRKGNRNTWFAESMLLGVVVVKLFIVDLVDSGTVTRIISFLTVGGLMLLIGYISPLPPKKNTGETE